MLKSLTGAIVAAAAFGGLAAQTTGASAMPMIDLSPAIVAQSAAGTVQDVRWCGPYRCYGRPQHFRPVYGWHRWHRPYWGGGWHHRWHRW